MKRLFSCSTRIVLCASLALGFVGETALAESLYSGAKTKPDSTPTGQEPSDQPRHSITRRLHGPGAGPGGGSLGGLPRFRGPVVGNPQVGRGPYAGNPAGYGGFHEGPWNNRFGGGGFGYGGHGFGGFPVGGGVGGLLFMAGAAAAAAANADNHQEASPPPRRRVPTAARTAPASAAPPAKAIAHAPPPAPAKAIAHAAPPPPPAASPRLASNAHPPPPGEAGFRPGEVLVSTPPGVTPASIAWVLRRHRITEAEVTTIALTGQSLRLWRFPVSRPVASVVRELGGETALASIQPNYRYAIQGDAANAPSTDDQYALGKLGVDASLDLASRDPVRVAVIDTAIDEAHPDLKGAIEARFDAIGGAGTTHALEHGTSMAGAIAAHGWVKGVAPTVRILSARALDRDDRGLEMGSTESVMKAVQWSVDQGARVINMSFAGPIEDPALHAELAAAYAKGLVLIGAAGNDGPKSPPRYPGADENVVAVTATDSNDAVYSLANAGSYVAVAAPGVDVLLTAPNGAYAMETGTSVSAALVSGVAALLLERRPQASPLQVKTWLMRTAEPLGVPRGNGPVGAGLVDARRAVEAAAD